MNHAHPQQFGGSDTLTLEVRRLRSDDMAFALSTWRESFRKSSSALIRLPWPLYKQSSGRKLQDLLFSDTTLTIGAFSGENRIIGWLAYTPGKSISTVHWCYVRNPARRRGVMEMLVDAAELGKRFCYTHRGERQAIHHGSRDRSPDAVRHVTKGPTLDLAIVEWLRTRGQTATFVDLEEWMR